MPGAALAERSSLQSCTAGFAGGVAGLVVGHPFDVVKTAMQGNPALSPRQCIAQTWRNHGTLGFFRGLSFPLLGVGPIFACYFLVYDRVRLLLSPPSTSAPRIRDSMLGGAAAGVALSPAFSIGERVKCVMQAHPRFGSAFEVLRELHRGGGQRSLWRGLGATCAREGVAGAAFFGLYELTLRSRWGDGRSAGGGAAGAGGDGEEEAAVVRGGGPPTALLFLAGGLAGVARWTASMPIDTVKTRMQVALPPHDTPTAREVARELLRKSRGIAPFYSGLPAMLLRAFPSTGALMLAVEFTNSSFSSSSSSAGGGGAVHSS